MVVFCCIWTPSNSWQILSLIFPGMKNLICLRVCSWDVEAGFEELQLLGKQSQIHKAVVCLSLAFSSLMLIGISIKLKSENRQ